MSTADALVFPSHPPAGGLAAAGGGAGDDGDDPSPPKPSHAVDDADPIFPEEEEEEEDESTSPRTTVKDRPRPQEAPEGRRQYCSVCNKMFHSIKALHGHMRSHPMRNWRGTVPPHLKGAENEVADYLLILSGQEPERLKRRFICSSCNREFPTRQALGGHRASHKGQKGCYEKAKEAREYGPRLVRKRPPSETEAAGEIYEPATAAASSQPRAATPFPPPSPTALAPPAALPTTPPTAPVAAAAAPAQAPKRAAQGPPEAAARKRRLLDLNVPPVPTSSEDNSGGNGGGSSTSSGNKIER